MSLFNTKNRTNLFGNESDPFAPEIPAFVPPALPTKPTAFDLQAQPTKELVAKLQWLADQQLSRAVDGTSWLEIAAVAGQNQSDKSIAKRELQNPDDIKATDLFPVWAARPDPSTLPALPDNLKIDTDKITTAVQADITKLQTLWIAKFLPDSTDVSALNGLVNDVLNGTQSNAATAKLDALAAAVTSALLSMKTTTQNTLNTAITTMATNLATNFSDAKTGADGAITIAKDNTQNIAWANARGQIAREAARKEKEAFTGWAARGFTLPGGVLTKQIRESQQASLAAASEMAAQQAIKTQQMFFDSAKLQVDVYLRKMTEQAQSELARYRAVVDSNLRFGELELQANQTNAKIAFDHLGLRLDFTKFAASTAVEYRLGVINGMNGLVQAYAALTTKQTDYLNSISAAQQRMYSSLTEYYRAMIQNADFALRAEIHNNEKDNQFATIAAQFIGAAVGHHVEAAARTADVFARTAGMALSGLNGVASISASTLSQP